MYLRSDFYCFVLYHIARYRRNVVRDNLLKSFPEKPLKEIKDIEKKFYHDLCDVFVEAFKLRKLTVEELKDSITVTNPELLESLYGKGRSIILATQHSGNWEWFCNIMGQLMPYKTYAVYKKLTNRYFDQLIYDLRTNHSDNREMMIENKQAKTAFAALKGQPSSVLFLGDQSPKGDAKDYWTDFLHRDTCWYTGIEKLARRYDLGVVYFEMSREQRGHYNVTYHLIAEDPKQCEEGFILEQYVRHVERFIQTHPDNWLWSHRRWKHTREASAS